MFHAALSGLHRTVSCLHKVRQLRRSRRATFHRYRYCRLLEKYLGEPKLAKKRIVHYTSNEAQPRHNAVVLMCLFQVRVLMSLFAI